MTGCGQLIRAGRVGWLFAMSFITSTDSVGLLPARLRAASQRTSWSSYQPPPACMVTSLSRRARQPLGWCRCGSGKRGALIIAASSRQGGASAPSPRVRDDSGSKQCFFSVPHSRRYDFELLCETSEPEGDGQFKVPAALKHLPALDHYPVLSP